MAATGDDRCSTAIFETRTHAHADARPTRQWYNTTDIGCRAVHPAEQFEARRKVRDLQRVSVAIVQDGLQHGGILDIVLLCVLEIFDLDRAEATGGRCERIGPIEQCMKYRVAVRTRIARPDDTSHLVDGRVDCAIADDAQVEIRHMRFGSAQSRWCRNRRWWWRMREASISMRPAQR